MRKEQNLEDKDKALHIGVVMLRNFMKTSNHIENIEGGRTAYLMGYYEFKNYFKKSKSTYYRWIKQLEEADKNFWYCKTAKLLFYYAT
jgi:hypothetical protein